MSSEDFFLTEGIEEKEQAVIQHIRTAGLKKNRETMLIEEVSELRRSRRRIFTDLMSNIKDIKSQLHAQNDTHSKILQEHMEKADKEHKKALEFKQSELDALRIKYEADIKIRESSSSTMEDKLRSMQRKYETKLSELEEKFSLVHAAKLQTNQDKLDREQYEYNMKHMQESFQNKID
eukprot:gene44303-59103_t